MKCAAWIVGLSAMFMGSCGEGPPTTGVQAAAQALGGDAQKDPMILASPRIHASRVTYKGLRLGMERSAAPREMIATEGTVVPGIPRDAFDTAQGDIISFKNDRIIRIQITDPEVLKVLDIKTREDIEKVFGKPGSVDIGLGSIEKYHYKDRNITVTWFKPEDRLNGVMVHNGDLDGFK